MHLCQAETTADSLLGQIQHIGPQEFYAFASALSEGPKAGAIVLHAKANSLQAARAALDRLLVEVGRQVREQGGRVVDVLT